MQADFELRERRVQSLIETAPLHEWRLPDGTLWLAAYREGSGYRLRFPSSADFTISTDTWRVSCWPVPDACGHSVEHLYLNQVLPLVLSRQGKLVFHASAVEVGGTAVAFLGESGLGKSTLAASFATTGFPLLTDDGAVVETDAAGTWVLPSHPSVRLWEDSEIAVVGADAPRAPPLGYTPKARFLAGGRIAFCAERRQVRRVYFLGDGSSSVPRIEVLGSGAAMIALVKHSFLLDATDRKGLAAHFEELTSFANQPIFFELDFPRSFDGLQAVRQAVIRHVESPTARA